ncbi:MAG: NAD(P)/FAD-dependent oxidoreductase [Pseudomonadota bacterium]
MKTDVLIIGAGAAGMMCAIQAAKRGRSVLLIDHYKKLAEKIRISGGGHCNFTNLNAKPENYLSANPHFCRSALARYTPQDFIALLSKHGIGYHEKTLGQLFCDNSSEAVITMLRTECEAAGVQRRSGCNIASVRHGDGFQVGTDHGDFRCASLVVACGGLSIPKIGATPLGYQIAEQFGLPIVKLRPGLVPLTFTPDDWAAYKDLAGVSLQASVSFGKQSFREDMLFTHRGLSGPVILQISSYWQPGQALHINLLPDHDVAALLTAERTGTKLLSNFLAQFLPKKFTDIWCEQFFQNKPLKQYSEKQLAAIAAQLQDWQITPSGTVGYSKAEVTCGGVDTRALSSKTMQSNDVPGLYFIGEVVDVTGQLGGYNFQWAWASGYAAGMAV